MALIRIREQNGINTTISFDGGEECPITVTDPFSEKEEALLEWYFEEHLRFPFTEQVKAGAAAESITRYGEALFDQVFADRRVYGRYTQCLQSGVGTLRFELAGSPDFHKLHWEALKDPALPRAFALEAPMVRRNLTPRTVQANVRPSPTLNLLVVTARPSVGQDVGYRTISRPLVEGLRKANLRVKIDLLRPGTYETLVKCLEAVRDVHGAGYYHVIHFDVHGALLTYDQLQKGFEANRFLYQTRFGRQDIGQYDGLKAFLSLEGEAENQSDLVEASELANLLITHQVPIAVLNACQSGKQVGATETSLGSRLMQAGMQTVLAMGYSVTVTAAELMMRTLYDQFFAGVDLSAAIRNARLELHNRKGRRVYFNQTIDLEDWLLPVVYQGGTAHASPLLVRDFTPEERAAYYERQASSYRPPEPTYGFVGRDVDILRMEKRLLNHNLLLVRGMGGAGKTTLLHHLGAWWQTTGFVEQVFYFGYDERAWTRQQLIDAIARRLFSPVEYAGFQPLSLNAQQAMLTERMRAVRHLLILDNLESITGTNLAIQNTLPPEEREALRGFLADLAGGKTLVLLGSRGGEDWLVGARHASPLRADNVYELPGLDPEAASTLAERILDRHNATRYRDDPDFQKLLTLLDGYPLALEVVLANLPRQTPTEILNALQTGDEAVDMRSEKKTESILRCIDYSHSNLSPEAQGLLTCLAPFTSVIFKGMLEGYTEKLRGQPALAHLPFDRWDEVLGEASNWGLLSPDEMPDYLRLQPILPYFLRSRLRGTDAAEVKRAIETAFRQHYDGLGNAMYNLLISREAAEKQLGQAIARLEYENLATALNLALEAQVSILNPYFALSFYLDATQDHRRGLELGETVLSRLGAYPPEALAGPLGVELVGLIDNIGKRQLLTQQFAGAEASYQKALSIWLDNKHYDADKIREWSASIYHQLGVVAQEQRQWAQAERYYQQALEIKIAFNDRYEQASTYHQLGVVAQEQRQWAQAERYYQQALEIDIAFNDRYEQASTYHQLGQVAQEQRQWAQAERYYQQALEIKIAFNDRYKQASTYHNLGIVAQAQWQWAQAERYYRQALEITIAFNDRYSQARTYHQLGRVAEEQRQWAQAERYYQQALEITIAFNDRYSLAKTYHQLGVVAGEQRQWAQAERYYQQALEITIAFDDRYSQASTYHQLGRVAEEQRQWAQAEQYYQQALEICIAFDDRYSQASTYHQLGRVAQEQRQWAQARDYFLKALAIFVEFKDAHIEGIALRSLGRLWQESGDAGLPAAAALVLGVTPAEAEGVLRNLPPAE